MTTATQMSLISGCKKLQEKVIDFFQSKPDAPFYVSLDVSFSCDYDYQTWLEFLSCISSEQKIFFQNRAQTELVCAFGSVDTLKKSQATDSSDNILEEMTTRLKHLSKDSRYYGGMSFHQDQPVSSIWSDFGVQQFILPLIEFRVKKDGKARLICQLLHNVKFEDVMNLLESMITYKPQPHRPIRMHYCHHFPGKSTWQSLFRHIQQDIRQDQYRKLVLARSSRFETLDTLNSSTLLHQLMQEEQSSYDFLFQFSSKSSFIGRSPECLFHRKGKSIFSEAVAGTRSRGSNPQADSQLATELAQSEKDTMEHQHVSDAIYQQLQPICDDLETSQQPKILKLAFAQHLHFLLEGTLRPQIGDTQLIDTLFPTPAVAGTPSDVVRSKLKIYETFDRGWYSGLVGYISREETLLIVSIRSALVYERLLIAYAGAGIIDKSEALKEWQELDLKIQPFQSLLT